MKSMKFVIAAGLLAVSATASAGEFNVGPCKACHAIDHASVGPAWKLVAEKYGSAEALAKVFKDGFKVEDRKVIQADPKLKGQAATMTGMYGTYIKGHEEDAANALFAAVKAGKM